MTTQKQSAANKANAQKSTGAVTTEGKAVVAGNAIKHGILSSQIILAGESREEYHQLLDDMNQALHPVGILELALSEKIAAAIWKQRRLVEAETSSIELSRDLSSRRCRQMMSEVLGLAPSKDDLVEVTEAELDQIAWCKQVVLEVDLVDNTVLETNNLSALAEVAPLTYKQLKNEAEEEKIELAEYIRVYLKHGVFRWALELAKWCKDEIKKYERRPVVQAVAKLVRSRQSAPVEMELMARYQVALDAELYRAMEALRKQQEWRIKSGYEIESEVVAH
jgi:hypothetical protein